MLLMLIVENDATVEENCALRVACAECREQVVMLREDNGRKSKLLAASKAARIADVEAVAMWKKEAQALEEKTKRCVCCVLCAV